MPRDSSVCPPVAAIRVARSASTSWRARTKASSWRGSRVWCFCPCHRTIVLRETPSSSPSVRWLMPRARRASTREGGADSGGACFEGRWLMGQEGYHDGARSGVDVCHAPGAMTHCRPERTQGALQKGSPRLPMVFHMPQKVEHVAARPRRSRVQPRWQLATTPVASCVRGRRGSRPVMARPATGGVARCDGSRCIVRTGVMRVATRPGAGRELSCRG